MSERAAKLFAVLVNEATADGERAAAATAACAVYRGDGFVGLQKPGWSQIPNIHGSVDAAMALVAKAREWGWDFQCGSNATGFYCLFDTAHTEECVDAPTLPAAIALCFLKLPVPTP